MSTSYLRKVLNAVVLPRFWDRMFTTIISKTALLLKVQVLFLKVQVPYFETKKIILKLIPVFLKPLPTGLFSG